MRPGLITLLVAATLAAGAPLPVAVASGPGRSEGVLAVGSRGPAVRVLQRRLGLPPDGIYGRRTERAVRRFQRRRALTVTGQVDAATRTAFGLEERAPSTGGAASADDLISMVEAARSGLGRPYRASAAGPDAFDCSGLVVWAGEAAGLTLPRSSFAQYEVGEAVAPAAVEAGDLVFFDTAGPGASDVGIAVSPAKAVSATTHGVREHEIFGAYWGRHFVGTRRLPAP